MKLPPSKAEQDNIALPISIEKDSGGESKLRKLRIDELDLSLEDKHNSGNCFEKNLDGILDEMDVCDVFRFYARAKTSFQTNSSVSQPESAPTRRR